MIGMVDIARRKSWVFLCAAAVALLSAPTVVDALAPSGKAVAVIQATSASGPGGTRTLAAAKPVFSGDRINTSGRGEAQIIFADDTRLVVGPNSSIVIDKFVYNPGSSGAQVSMQLAKGAFRFISGRGTHKNFEITTPSATLGARGTAFDVAVGSQIGTGLLVFDGSVQICSRRNGQCTLVNRGCNAAVVTNNGNLGAPNSTADRAALIRAAFPLVPGQRQLKSEFRVDTRACGNLILPPINGNVRQINLSPAGGVIDTPPSGSPGGPPTGGGLGAPGASNPNGKPGSSNSSASETARNSPGNSGNSHAGGNSGSNSSNSSSSNGHGNNK